MKEEIENPPAFPRTSNEDDFVAEGMTLRDYFAAKAMQMILKNSCAVNDYDRDERSQSAYSIADAMLKERSK